MYAGDVDGDGRDELVAEGRQKVRGKPDAVTLTLVWFDPSGNVAHSQTLVLGNKPILWDADQGLWAVDREGLVRLDPAGGPPTRIVEGTTAVSGLGPTRPTHHSLAHDLDGDGSPELIYWSAGRYVAVHADGTPFGSIPAPAHGGLDSGFNMGGDELVATIRPPPLSINDVDGDGRIDLVLPLGDHVNIYYTGAAVGARATDLRLPLDLNPPAPLATERGTRRDISGVWLQDLDGDKRVDLGVHRTVHDGNWFGATAEWIYARGTGAGFEPMTVVPIPQAAFAVKPVDADGNGRQELLAALVDVGFGNIARAFVTRDVQASLVLFSMNGGAYAATPSPIRVIHFPVQDPGRLHVDLSADLDGDKRIDLVTDDGTDRLSVYRGLADGFSATPSYTSATPVPRGDQSLYVHDVTGDGRAEVILWGEGLPSATLLRVE